MERQKFYNEIDMLKGNLARISVSDKRDDIDKNYENAKYRLDKIYKMRIDEFEKRGR